MFIYWPYLSLICTSGALGGLLRGLVSENDSAIHLPISGKRVPLGFVGDCLLGIGGALAIFLVGATLLNSSSSDIDEKELVQIVSLSLIAGFSGRTLVNALAARLMRQVQKIDEEVTLMEKALRSMKKHEDSTEYGQLGDFYKAKDDYELAQSFYDRALEIDQDNVGVMINKAFVLKRRGKIETALDLLNHTISISPDNERALYNRACYKCLLKYSVGDVLVDLKAAITQNAFYRDMSAKDPDLAPVRETDEYRQTIQRSNE